jgi:hypothetical protein
MNTFLEIINAASTSEALSRRGRENLMHSLESLLLEDSNASDSRHEILRSLLWQANEDDVDMIPPSTPTEDDVDTMVAAFLLIDYELVYADGIFNIVIA